jgi:phage FluMu protein Com
MEEGGPTVIMDLTVTLDFACCSCDDPVSVTLQCSGKGLAGDQAHVVASVSVPCPHCGVVNQILFEPSGQVRSVKPYRPAWPLPVPSVN